MKRPSTRTAFDRKTGATIPSAIWRDEPARGDHGRIGRAGALGMDSPSQPAYTKAPVAHVSRCASTSSGDENSAWIPGHQRLGLA